MEIYNKYKLSAEDKMMDASNLYAWLEERKEASSYVNAHVNQACQLERIFYILDGTLDLWAIAPNNNIALYDTTANTNRAAMKLGCGTTVDKNGKTRLLFVSLLVYQDADSFQWVFEQALTAFHTPPRVIFTDSDKAMSKAIAIVWPQETGTIHMLCTWHMSKNHFTNMKPTAGKAWHGFLRRWWQICKNTDINSR